MTIKLILFLICGISIGIGIRDKFYKEEIESREDLIKTYDEYIEFLEGECVEGYKKALDDTLKDNIKLRKKLKAYE
ncbi:hypothetical protein EV204_11268 [Tissierella praeacuta]|uniref:hypothetical protein n=1 Tax=Tissierella praeacuta TaxID=43131 RepID=UPI0010505A67|nr:hypothetical protein [Tissierella praeacuta]TCU67517.1 hypothetical protein EV204_11268 [Tissierella praeacuta]